MFFLAKRDGKLNDVPHFPHLKEADPRKGFLEQPEFEALLAARPKHIQPLITFLYLTGCRVSASQKIKWSQVNLELHEIRLEAHQVKNHEAITLPLPQRVIDMSPGEPHDPESYLFHHGDFRTLWENCSARLGLGEVEPKPRRHYRGLIIHDLRRSAVRNPVRAGVSEKVAMTISGHKTRAIFDRYNITSTSDKHAVMSRVEASMQVIEVGANSVQMPALLPEKI